jgi:hypothetical protein
MGNVRISPWIVTYCRRTTVKASRTTGLPPPDKLLWQAFSIWRTSRSDHAAREKLLTH